MATKKTTTKVEEVKEVMEEAVETVETVEAVEEAKAVVKKAVVNVPLLNIREDASLESKIITTCRKGDEFEVIEEKDGFAKIGKGWIKLEFVQLIEG